ncbi:MAG TPA: MFS transporter [Gaiellaceae bacterium]|nr:MFS transporter [Gaiellaceae bacterium]
MTFRRGPLAERDFRLLLAGRTLSLFGTAMSNIAIAFAILDLTGSKADVGYVLASQQLPKVVFLLLGGVWADRLPRHRVMVVTGAISGAAQCASAALLLTHEAGIVALAALAAVNGSAAAFFTPAARAALPGTVPEALLQPANAMLRMAQNSTVIGGTAAAGVLVATVGPGYAILIDGLTYFGGSAFIEAMRAADRDLSAVRANVFRELREGWDAFRSQTWLWTIVVQFSFVNAVENGSMNVLGPPIAKASLGGPAVWGAILTAQAVGYVVTGFLMIRIRVRRLLFFGTVCVFPMALPLLALARPLPAVLIGLFAFLGGASLEVFAVAWYTVLQRETPRHLLSRVSAWDDFGSIVFVPLGLAVAGPVAEAVGDRATLLGSAAIIVVSTALVLLVRDVRRL